jgi:GT2 family glycosyltransferase
MNPKVTIIILNWNGWQDTIECLESLYQNNYPNYDVIIVDNASHDDSLEKIRDYCQGKLKVNSNYFNYTENNKPFQLIQLTDNQPSPKKDIPVKSLILIKNKDNQGFAKGNNTGIKFALKQFYPEYILLLNNDTVVDPEFLMELVKTGDSNEKIGFIGPKTYLYDNKEVIQAAGGGNIDFLHGESHEAAFMEEDTGKFDKDFEIDYVGGSCLLVKRKVIEKVGVLDEGFFMYWEDVDWCFNGREAGYKSIYSFKSKIWHKYGTSSKNYFKTYYHNRNRVYFMKKHATKKYYRKFMYHYLAEIVRESGYQLLYRRDWKLFKSLLKGTIDGLRMNVKNLNLIEDENKSP